MDPEELEILLYIGIAYKDVCEIHKYKTPSVYERYTFNNYSIWRHSKNSRTALITLSGGARLEMCQYIQKLVDGLDLDADTYGIENFDNFNFCCIEGVADFIRSIAYKYDHLIVMGFSMGGIIASHALAQLNGECGATTLIVLSTPFNPNTGIYFFDKIKLCRVDFSHLFFKAFRNSLEHNRGVQMSDVFTIGKYDGYARFIEKTYELPNFRLLMKMNPNIPNCRVLSFYNTREVVIFREPNVPEIETFKSELDASSTFEEYEFETRTPGHNSEWAQEANLQIIVKQIRSVLDKKM